MAEIETGIGACNVVEMRSVSTVHVENVLVSYFEKYNLGRHIVTVIVATETAIVEAVIELIERQQDLNVHLVH